MVINDHIDMTELDKVAPDAVSTVVSIQLSNEWQYTTSIRVRALQNSPTCCWYSRLEQGSPELSSSATFVRLCTPICDFL